MLLTVNSQTVNILGDPHLGRKFTRNVPLHRVGERERMVWEDFHNSLTVKCDIHVNLGDLFDKFHVPFDVVWYAAKAYSMAAIANPDRKFIILKGNHDWDRDLTRRSSFDVFELAVSVYDNIEVVSSEPYETNGFAFLPWHPTISASDMVALTEDNFNTAFGHWDIESFGGNDDNLLPDKALVDRGCNTAITGHIHKKSSYQTPSGLSVMVHGSMQPYAHGEESDDSLYLTLRKSQIESAGDLTNKCVRVVLENGETLDEPIDCLQLVVKQDRLPGVDDDQSVELEAFDMDALVQKTFADYGVADHISAGLLAEFNSRRITSGS